MIRIGLEFDRPVPESWQRDLEVVGGRPGGPLTWMLLDWMPGEPEKRIGFTERAERQEVGRYVLYEMFPPHAISETFLEVLQGPPPNRARCRKVIEGKLAWASDSMVTQREWELYRQTGCLPRLYWIIQGGRGGHKRRFNPSEERFLKLQRLPTEPPIPGTLHYAPFDQRVIEKLAEQDRLRRWGLALSYEKRTGRHEDAWRIDQEKTFNRALLGWLQDQIHEAVQETKNSWSPSDLPSPKEPVSFADEDEIEESFIDQTPSEMRP